jgi:hypothetical protein
MAHVVRQKSGSWEIRESRATPRGPRSRTLASFRELTPEVIRRARERASAPLDAEQVRDAARRAGAPVAAAGQAGAKLIAALAGGPPPPPGLRRVLLEALGSRPRNAVTDNERAASEWLGASPERRGETLRELLLLADRLPHRRRARVPRFPRIVSRAA